MSFPDIVPELKARMPELRGRLLANQSLGEFTWFRVGGPAQVFFMPDDENDLAYFLRNLSPEIPITVIGAGSNLIVRDGGVPGVVPASTPFPGVPSPMLGSPVPTTTYGGASADGEKRPEQ